MLDELTEVLTRDRFEKRIRYAAEGGPLAFVAAMALRAEVVELVTVEAVCRDSNDDKVIATALQGIADVLVTRDDDLKIANEVGEYLEPHGVKVLSVARFLDILESNGPAG